MNILPDYIVAIQGDILAHVFQEAPKEACGIIAKGRYHPCKNIHDSPIDHFAIAPKDYARIEKKGDIQTVFHSHVGSFNKFSPHDARVCRQMNVPWLMYCTGTDEWHYADPTGNAPYLGRQWHYGIQDCYSLARDFYLRELAIELDDFERKEEFEWTNPNWNMFEENLESQGFITCDSPGKKGDIFLMQLDAPHPNHFGVLVEPERNIFYHHLLDRLSEANVYGGYWEKNTSKILRHKELL